MDFHREHPTDFDLSSSTEADPANDIAIAIGSDERRMHVRAYNHWVSLLEGRDFPSIEDLEPRDVSDFSAHSIILDFTNIDDAGGNLMTMATQVRSAVAFVYKNAASFGGDPDRLYVSGHSSGGHLAGTVVAADWRKEFGLPGDLVKGALLCSGMYDLKPVRLSARSNYVRFTDAIEQELSALRHLRRIGCPLIVGYGTGETPEFQRQARDFAAALQAAGKPVRLLVGEGYNHFEMLETLASPYGLLGRAALEQMRIPLR